ASAKRISATDSGTRTIQPAMRLNMRLVLDNAIGALVAARPVTSRRSPLGGALQGRPSAIQPLADFLARLELGDIFLPHVDLRPGARIASHPGRPVLDRKRTEPAQFHPIAPRHR